MFRKIFGHHKTSALDIFAALIFLLALLIKFITGANFTDLLNNEALVEIGYLANGTDSGNFYYIDSGKGRVTGIRNNGVEFILTSGSDISDFYQAEDLCIDTRDNSFYVATVDWDSSGFLLGSERILHYDSNGKYIETAYEVLYQPTDEINKHRIFDIRFIDGKLSFVRADDKSVSLCTVEDGKIISEQSYDYPDAWVYFQNFAHDLNGTVYGAEKRGHIIKFADNTQSLIYTSPKNSKEVLYDLDILPNGKIFFVDVYGGRICRVISDKIAYPVISSQILDGKSTNGKGVLISNVYAKENFLFTVYNDSVVGFNSNGKILFRQNSFLMGQKQNLISYSLIFIFILGLLSLFYLALRLICHIIINRPKFSVAVISEIAAVILILITSSLVIYSISVPFQINYLNSISIQLKDMAIAGANRFNPDWLNNINYASDFMNDDYAEMSNLLHSITTNNHDVSSRYGAEINIIDDDGRAYAIVYTDNSIGTYYPMSPATFIDVREVYDTGKPLASKPTLAGGGTFLFGYAPIFNKNREVIGVFSITQDNYRVVESFNRTITNVVVSVMLVIIALIFLMNEGFAVIPQMLTEKKLGVKFASIAGNPAPLSMLRVMTFSVTFVLNMTSSFLSVYTSSFWNETLGISENLAGAIPLFANSIFLSLSALFCPYLHRKIGFRYLTAIGIICASSGDLLAGLSQNYASICLALLLNGVGFGILVNTISIALAMVEPPDKQVSGLIGYSISFSAGINIGTIAGAFLAGIMPYYKVFFVTSSLWALQIIMFWHVGKKIKRPVQTELIAKQSGNNKSRIKFAGILFLLFLCVPYSFIGSFEYFYIPIFVERLGYAATYTSVLFVIRAICVIALGGSLTEIMWNKLKDKAPVPAYLLGLLGWLLIANTIDLRIASVGMIFLGLSFAFGNNVITQTFLHSGFVKDIGEDTALSLYNFASGIGGSFSSIVFGLILGAGLSYGMSVFALICLVLLLSAFFILRKSK